VPSSSAMSSYSSRRIVRCGGACGSTHAGTDEQHYCASRTGGYHLRFGRGARFGAGRSDQLIPSSSTKL
jgi:hypothetical protein